MNFLKRSAKLASNAVTPGRSASLLTRLGASKDGYPYDEVAGKLPLFGREAELKSVAKIGERMSKEQYTQHIQTLYRRILRGGFDWANLDTDMAYRNWANDVRQEFEKYRNAEPGLAQQQILKASELIVCYFSKHPLPYKNLYKYGGGAFQRNVPPPLGLAEPPSPYIEHDAPAKSDQHH